MKKLKKNSQYLNHGKEVSGGKKKKKKTIKKSSHKHEYTWYKEYAGDGEGDLVWARINVGVRMEHSNWKAHYLCSLCGKEYNTWSYYNEERKKEILETAIDITPYSI